MSQWEGSLRWLWIALTMFVVAVVAAYRYGVPLLAGAVAEQVPQAVLDSISEATLQAADGGIFKPTTLPRERRKAIVDRFQRLRFPDGATFPAERIVFRAGQGVGANAMALPSGTMVVTDELVALTQDDDDIAAVLAHEAGHVRYRHGVRVIAQNSATAVLVMWLLGDVSQVAASASSALLDAKHSRDAEREADAYAMSVLRESQVPVEHLARMLERLEKAAGEQRNAVSGFTDYLSSHPVTAERLEAIRRR